MAGEISNGTIVDVQAGDLIPLYRPGQDPDVYNVLEATDEAWTTFTPNVDTNEMSGSPTFQGRYNKIGRQVTVKVIVSGTAGSANTFKILNMPFIPVVTVFGICQVTNNNTSEVGKYQFTSGDTIMTIYPSMTGAATGWTTGSVSKGIFLTFTYESTT